MLISVELLSEVMGFEVKDYAFSAHDKNLVFLNQTYWVDVDGSKHRSGCKKSVNIHELVHKFKQWAVSKGYTLVEAPLMLRITKLCTNQNKIWEYTLEEQNAGEYFKPEYTFKACEYIMKQSKRHHE